MKIHYINILLFELPLNILIYNQRNHYITRTPKATTRTLCECELYELANYDNDPQMKEVMQDFDRQTSQRFEEYDERMKTTRQKCKDKCDKEIQKIILKDKLEKQMEEQLTTLETKIDTDDIPTCICEKSVADKVEKGCLRCGYGLGSVAPMIGLTGSVAVNVWKTAELAAAKAAAVTEGAAKGAIAGIGAGKKAVIDGLNALNIGELGIGSWKSIVTTENYKNVNYIAGIIIEKRQTMCGANTILPSNICERIGKSLGTTLPNGHPGPPPVSAIPKKVGEVVVGAEKAAAKAAEATTKEATAAFEAAKKEAIEVATTTYYTPIIASIIAIVVIVLIMVIIYLILRYRRKKKMKKKLQYIKLLEE
ncbi:rifin [Plasmodium falciparum IGH-CR14]|uniref:Rifin n=1 Tax=Plasmodium falciparum IGH-CR14 TaxID=580059 RepID=A0A0L1IAE1_PLAFA|nr:rifin [Plasmodium falciparum IGH-CR14]